MKLFTIVVILIMLTSTALAGGIDLSILSLDELVGLRNNINVEIDIRTEDESAIIHPGDYVIGVDILPGSYLIKCVDSLVPSNTMLTYLINCEDTTDKQSVYIHLGESRYFTLEVGFILRIDLGTGNISTPSPFWRP